MNKIKELFTNVKWWWKKKNIGGYFGFGAVFVIWVVGISVPITFLVTHLLDKVPEWKEQYEKESFCKENSDTVKGYKHCLKEWDEEND